MNELGTREKHQTEIWAPEVGSHIRSSVA